MSNMDDWSLLRRYVEDESQADFETIVERYSRLVYSSAVRRAGEASADDITQAVFIVLAKKAGTLKQKKSKTLSSWLYKTTQYAASQAARDLRRRQERENSAAERQTMLKEEHHESALWEQVKPVLDTVIDKLNAKDKEAVLLRFFQDSSYAEIGEIVGVSENTATKRVARALEKMKGNFRRRGVALSIPVLTSFLASRTAEAATETLLSSCVVAAVTPAQAVVSVSSALMVKGAIKMMWLAQLQKAVAVACVMAVVAEGSYITRSYLKEKPTFELYAVQPFILTYKGDTHLSDGSVVHQVNLRGNEKSLFLKKGDSVEGFKVVNHIEKEELRNIAGIAEPRAVDVSQLVVEYNGREVFLSKDKYVESKRYEAMIGFTDGDRVRRVIEGDVIDMGGRHYKVISIDPAENEVVLINLYNSKEVRVTKSKADDH